MPRFTLSPANKLTLGNALLAYAKANNLDGATALATAAAATTAELQAAVTAHLNAAKALRQAQLAAIPARATAETNRLNAEIADIDATIAGIV